MEIDAFRTLNFKQGSMENLELGKCIIKNGKFGDKYRGCYHGVDKLCMVLVFDENQIIKAKQINDEYFSIIKNLKPLNHENIVKIIDIYQENRYLHIVLENFTGNDLCFEMKNKIKNGYAFNEHTTSEYIMDLLKGVAFLNEQKIVNKNLQPHNIIVEKNLNFHRDPNHQSFILKIVDFSKARILDYRHSEKLFDQDKELLNHFSSPEILNMSEYNQTTDVWSIAVIAYIMISGSFPFCASTFDRMVKKMLCKKFYFNSFRWDEISTAMKDFLRDCFNPDYKERLHAAQAMNHFWFTSSPFPADTNVVRTSHSIDPTKRFTPIPSLRSKNFKALAKFRKAVYAILAFLYFKSFLKSPKQVHQSKEICSKITENILQEKSSPLLFESLSKETLKTLIETFDKIKEFIPYCHNFNSILEYCKKEIESKDLYYQKLVILKKESIEQKIGILVIETPEQYCIISKIMPGGLADREGNLEVGDRILSINGTKLGWIEDDKSKGSQNIVMQANKLLSSSDLEIVILAEFGYKRFVSYRESKTKIEGEIKRSNSYIKFLRVLKSSRELSEFLYHCNSLEFLPGDVIVLNEFKIYDEKFFFAKKIVGDTNELTDTKNMACTNGCDGSHTEGYVPIQLNLTLTKKQLKNLNKGISCGSGFFARKSFKFGKKSLTKSQIQMFSGLYEQVSLVENYSYKMVILVAHCRIDFNTIIKDICSRLVLTHGVVCMVTTNPKFAENPKFKVVKEQDFLAQIKHKQLIEWGVKNNYYYGFSKNAVFDVIQNKRIPILGLHPRAIITVRNVVFQPLIIYLHKKQTEQKNQNVDNEMNENDLMSLDSVVVGENSFKNYRHLVDFYLEFESNSQISMEILKLLQGTRCTFVPEEWKNLIK